MLEMRNARRPHLDEQRLEGCVLGAGDQYLIDHLEHAIRIRDFLIDIRLCKRGKLS